MSATAAAVVALAGAGAGCADDAPPPPRQAPVVASAQLERPAHHRTRPKPKPVDRSADVATELGVDVADLVWSPSHQLFAATPAPEKLAVFGVSGDKRLEVETARHTPIAELRFMDDERIVYLVPPPPAPKHAAAPHHAKRRAGSKKPAPPPPPTTLYAIQPIQDGAAPVLCEGRRFTFSPKGDHLAWVAGDPGSEYVAADGAQVYPRSGVTSIQGEPAWSQDGASLAFIETGDNPRLVVLVEVRNPHGDNTWPLPPEATDPTLRVFWSGVGRLVVGTELTKPRFATSFTRDAGAAEEEDER